MKSFGDRKFSSRTRHCNFEEVNKNITFGEPEMEHWNCGVNCSALLAVTTLILGVLLLVMKIIAPQVKHGPVFSFTVLGKSFTFCIGSKAPSLFYNSKNDELNAEELYRNLTLPIFGSGVAFDCPHQVYMEQKQIVKSGWNISNLRTCIPEMEEEVRNYCKSWGNTGKIDMIKAANELYLLIAARCLHGTEIRERMDSGLIELVHDLDRPFKPWAWLIPYWVPLPSYRKRDVACLKLKKMYEEAMNERRAAGRIKDDMLQTLMDSTYKNGRHLTDNEISGLLLGLRKGAQNNSSVVTEWTCFYMAKHKHIQNEVYEEQLEVFGKELEPLDYDGLQECKLLDRCHKESLRLGGPSLVMMRLSKAPVEVLGYTIPAGHLVCVSPNINHRLPEAWDEPDRFNPDRFLDEAAGKANYSFTPYGSGRHRCLAETFADLMMRVTFATLIRMFEFDLLDGQFPEVNYQTLGATPLNPYIVYKKRVPNNTK